MGRGDRIAIDGSRHCTRWNNHGAAIEGQAQMWKTFKQSPPMSPCDGEMQIKWELAHRKKCTGRMYMRETLVWPASLLQNHNYQANLS